MIHVKGLTKTFTARGPKGTRTVDAVRGVDLEVEAGQIYGVLGPNGAGKTTTIRMLATLIRPDAGTATIAGHDLLGEPGEIRRALGYVSQAGGVEEQSSARAQVTFAARLYGVADPSGAADRVLKRFDLAEIADRPGRTLSGGQRRRVAIALGLVHSPPLLLLDEPTTGLDPQNRANLWDRVRELREQGTSVLLSTHYLEEADALCDRLAIVDHGVVVAEGTPAELKREVSGDVATLRLDGPERAPHDRTTLDDVFLARTGRSLRDTGADA
ncbi:ABC transporter ATP-binding protein [Nonomuraea sp. CA-218870]|uniref:ABC transporter ATP-binding protein n=1 Tax=Nonomuraea sp. CA-218870 TaxID=3239998 RepID=UPI003D8F0A07